MKVGLVGFPLAHSFSKKYFEEKFQREQITNASYELFPIEAIDKLPALLLQEQLDGLNVTIPYKEQVLAYCTHLSDEVAAIGAANCLKIIGNEVHAFNTDVFGFAGSIQPYLKPHHSTALILGTGGSAKAVQFVLKQLGIPFQHVSRSSMHGCLTYSALSLELIEAHPIIINTTPLGMFPNIVAKPAIPYSGLSAKHIVFDLVYNPAQTAFLQAAAQQGAVVVNGLEMLHLQAEKSWEIWSNSTCVAHLAKH